MERKREQIRGEERGATLLLAVASLLVLLAMAGFAIDALKLYVARTDAQRAADAAALAGAKVFVSSGCTTSANCTSGATQALVVQQAQVTGGQNKVFGQPASIAASDVTFPPSPTGDPHDPMVQVKVHRVIPTMLIAALSRMLGGNPAGINVVGTATAEAFNPTGSNIPFATSCVKPWMMPNCDPIHKTPANPNCGASGGGYFVQGTPAQIVNPGYYNGGAGGVIGEPWTLHFGILPSQYGEISFTGANNSANVYRNEIEGCAPEAALACGNTVYTNNGQATGPTNQGTNTLINGPNGQDSIDTTQPPPFVITAGSGNPYFPSGSQISSSSSIVTVPVYDTPGLCPGNSCGNTQTVVGFMQLFIRSMKGNADIDAVILNVVACPPANNGGGSGGTGTPPVGSNSATLIPVRLVRNP